MGMYKRALEEEKQADQALQPDAGNRFDELYKQYMDEPKRKRMRERGIGFGKYILPLVTAGIGAGWGSMAGAGHKAPSLGRQDAPTCQSATSAGAAVGGGIGLGLGILAAALLNSHTKEAMQASQEDEAWRYAAMLSGRAPDPRSTLV